MTETRIPGSFRDPAGYVFAEGGQLFRRILPAGREDFRCFTGSGLAGQLIEECKLVPFTPLPEEKDGSQLLRLEALPFISYPYEWSFGQLRDAGLLTLELMRKALHRDLILKDASAFNIAFRGGKAVFLDHTSFTAYRGNEPWRAYRQFVMHFLAPLMLMKKVDLRCLSLFRSGLDGIPLDLASRLLPWTTQFDPDILFHIHLHARFDRRYSADTRERKIPPMPKKRLENLIRSLQDCLGGLDISAQNTQWAEYYGNTSYSDASFQFKRERTKAFCREIAPRSVCDLGANTGVFSKIAARYASEVIASDIDPQAVERLYVLSQKTRNLHPVLLDLNNPSPDLGVFNEERRSFLSRCRCDLALGLALVHHLRITGNWTLEQIARLFGTIAPNALVEFVPAEDVQVKRLMRGREKIYADWTLDDLLAAFRPYYSNYEIEPIPDSPRTLIRLRK
ncbi:MAG: SAM-dependent methyltransferase [Lentisphaeria bacterium]|nr:SAM-dependent methyltransferase [Lentisphaeria bacterium]